MLLDAAAFLSNATLAEAEAFYRERRERAWLDVWRYVPRPLFSLRCWNDEGSGSASGLTS